MSAKNDPLSKLGLKLSEETRKRCHVFAVPSTQARKFRAINPELFHFLYDVASVDFKIYVRVSDVMIEFIKKEDFSRELLDQLWGSMERAKRRIEICVLATDYDAFQAVVVAVRKAKVERLVSEDPSLDRRTLDVFSVLSEVSQMIVKGGVNAEVARRVKDSAAHMVTNLLDSQAAISTLSRMMIHDPTLYDHSATVAMLACTIARHHVAQPLSVRESTIIAQCSLYHDVGKTCVPSSILNKPGKFTPEEFEVMKSHASLGEEELRKLVDAGAPIEELAVRVAGEHHEKFTGKGYPRGRRGRYEDDPENGIHLYTRIVTIADIYSALLMKRVYKPAFAPQDAIKIMADTAADDFDPLVFEPFVRGVVKSLNRSERETSAGRILTIGEDGKLREVTPPTPTPLVS